MKRFNEIYNNPDSPVKLFYKDGHEEITTLIQFFKGTIFLYKLMRPDYYIIVDDSIRLGGEAKYILDGRCNPCYNGDGADSRI